MAKFLLNARPLSGARTVRPVIKFTGTEKKIDINDIVSAVQAQRFVYSPVFNYRLKGFEIELVDGQGQLVVQALGRDVLVTERSTGIDGKIVSHDNSIFGIGHSTLGDDNGSGSGAATVFQIADATDDKKIKYLHAVVEIIDSDLENRKVA